MAQAGWFRQGRFNKGLFTEGGTAWRRPGGHGSLCALGLGSKLSVATWTAECRGDEWDPRGTELGQRAENMATGDERPNTRRLQGTVASNRLLLQGAGEARERPRVGSDPGPLLTRLTALVPISSGPPGSGITPAGCPAATWRLHAG